MGWDKGRYYTQSKKVKGRVVRTYVGMGQPAQLIAEMDALEREQRQLQALEVRLKKQELAGLDVSLKRLNRETDLIVRALLVANGFRQHKRGEWRKTRAHKSQGRCEEVTGSDRSSGEGRRKRPPCHSSDA